MTSRLYDSILTNDDIILKYKSLPNLNIGKKEHFPTSYDYINKTVFSYRQYLATKIIKQQWRICRWNPTYSMCKSIQYKNYTDIINAAS
jgi:hypothetical protein